jgi:hypothetical protein
MTNNMVLKTLKNYYSAADWAKQAELFPQSEAHVSGESASARGRDAGYVAELQSLEASIADRASQSPVPVRDLTDIFLSIRRPETLEAAFTQVCERAGKAIAAESLFAQDFAAYRSACADGNLGLSKKLVSLAKNAGDQKLVNSMIGAQDYVVLKDAVHRNDRITALLIINALDDAAREQSLELIPMEWSVFHQSKKVRPDEVWQDMGGGAERWPAIINQPAPSKRLAEQSPYKFRPKLYEQILPEIRIACAIEGRTNAAELCSYKLAVLFSNTQEIERYFKECARQSKEDGKVFSLLKTTDFEIPVRGLWNVDHWRSLALQFGHKGAQKIGDAPQIEAQARKTGEPLPATLSAVRALHLLAQYESTRSDENFAIAASANGVDTYNYDHALQYVREHGKDTDQMPDIFIDGADIGYPNYYFCKVAPRDPMQCLLGSINNHSQYLTNPAGQFTLPHIVASQFAAAYVLKKKTGGKITPKDQIIADTLAYISEQNHIIFDGIGAKDSTTSGDGPPSETDKKVRDFLEQFAFEVVDKHKFTGTSATLREGIETVRPDRIRKDANALYIEAVRLGDDKEWIDVLGRSHKQISAEDFGQIFNPQDKMPGWMHNESQDHHLLIPPRSHRTAEAAGVPDTDEKYTAALEEEAKAYIARTTAKIKEKYGIVIQMGIGLEMHAYDKEGIRTSDVDKAAVNEAMKNAGLDSDFEPETGDRDGQYEAKTQPRGAMEAAKMATDMRAFLQENAGSFGLSRFAFDSVLKKDSKNKAPVEPSSAHINATLWSTNGKPLTRKEGDAYSVLTNVVAKGLMDAERKLSVLFAQSARDFELFGYLSPEKKKRNEPFFAPTHIFAVTSPSRINEGPTINISSSDVPSQGSNIARLETRMTGSSGNYYAAMAGTLAGIEWALDNYTWVVGPENDLKSFPETEYKIVDTDGKKLAIHNEFTLPEKKYTGWSGVGYSHRKKSYVGKHPQEIYTIPATRSEAVQSLAARGNQEFARQRLGEKFYSALVLQQVPASMQDKFGITIQQSVEKPADLSQKSYSTVPGRNP